MRKIFTFFFEFVFFGKKFLLLIDYQWNGQTCVFSVSFYESNFVLYPLAQLTLSHISLKDEQRLATRAMHKGRDTFVCLPTGYGKSLCYQALLFVIGFKNDCDNCAVVVVSSLAHRRPPCNGTTIKLTTVQFVNGFELANKFLVCQ